MSHIGIRDLSIQTGSSLKISKNLKTGHFSAISYKAPNVLCNTQRTHSKQMGTENTFKTKGNTAQNKWEHSSKHSKNLCILQN